MRAHVENLRETFAKLLDDQRFDILLGDALKLALFRLSEKAVGRRFENFIGENIKGMAVFIKRISQVDR